MQNEGETSSKVLFGVGVGVGVCECERECGPSLLSPGGGSFNMCKVQLILYL